MPDAYASADDLTAWLPPSVTFDVDDAPRLLMRASELMDQTVRAFYPVDVNGIPTDPVTALALKNATCAQVEQWLEVSEENDIDGLAGTSVQVAGKSGYVGSRAVEVAPRAFRQLSGAGLLGLAAQRGTAADEFFLVDADSEIS